MTFSAQVLAIDPEAVCARIEGAIREQVLGTLRRRGAVVGLSGGVDSSVVAALSARALGPERVLALFMPERDSSDDSLRLGRAVAESLGVASLVEDIEAALAGAGCYDRRDAAIRQVVPDWAPGWKCKLALPSLLDGDRLNVSYLIAARPDGSQLRARLPAEAYLALVAATNMKQRTRKAMEYYHADRLVYAVAGTPNRLEYDQGFFVKNGDGAADFKPIAHLYKTQVYALARYLGIPDEVIRRPPTTDTYSLSQTQEEFYFALPYDQMDLCLYGLNHDVPADRVAPAMGLSPDHVARVYKDIEAKRRVARYLGAPPLLVEPL